MSGLAVSESIAKQKSGNHLICQAYVLYSLRLIVALVLLALPAEPLAVDDIQVLGLFRGKAVLQIDGARRVLTDGERSPEGVTLVESNSNYAVLEIHGRRSKYAPGSRVSTAFSKPVLKRASIYRNPQGTYTTVGSINGMPVNFLVDTGATAIAMGSDLARRLGLNYRLQGQRIVIQTAAGKANAYKMKLMTVKVGDIVQKNVEAYIIDGEAPKAVLLGMSYLNRLKIRNEGYVMHLEQKY